MSFPNLDELGFLIVIALPNASIIGDAAIILLPMLCKCDEVEVPLIDSDDAETLVKKLRHSLVASVFPTSLILITVLMPIILFSVHLV
jgi:hypothetical protein